MYLPHLSFCCFLFAFLHPSFYPYIYSLPSLSMSTYSYLPVSLYSFLPTIPPSLPLSFSSYPFLFPFSFLFPSRWLYMNLLLFSSLTHSLSLSPSLHLFFPPLLLPPPLPCPSISSPLTRQIDVFFQFSVEPLKRCLYVSVFFFFFFFFFFFCLSLFVYLSV